MAVLSKISVGDIFYYVTDDVPVHTAPKGSISLLDDSSGFDTSVLFVNNDGGNTWLKTISSSYGEMTLNDYSTGVDYDSQTAATSPPYSWYSFNGAATYQSGELLNFSKQNDATFGDNLRYDGNNLIKVVTMMKCTNRSGTNKWMSWRIAPATNFISPPLGWNEFYTLTSNTNGAAGTRIIEMNTNDNLTLAISGNEREGGGGPSTGREYLPKHGSLSVVKIDEALVKQIFLEDWESNSFATNSWTTVNDTTNIWTLGTAQNNTSGGTYGAYVSNDGGTTATYDVNTANVSHFYKDFNLPSQATKLFLIFDWKCQGENTAGDAVQYDYGTVVITGTATTPTAGTEVSTTEATPGGDGRIGAGDNDGKFNLGYGTNPGTTWNTETIDISSYIGQTKRIVFTWKNDGSVGADPPFIVDNIKVVEYIW